MHPSKHSVPLFAIGISVFLGSFAFALPALAASDAAVPANARGMMRARFASTTNSVNPAGMMPYDSKAMQGTRGWAKTDGAAETPLITGNGQPIIGGSVTAINGSTLTVTNKNGVTYAVNASAATVHKTGAAATLSNVVIGDVVLIQGTVNGTSVTASLIIDHGTIPVVSNSDTGSRPVSRSGGFSGMMGGFFSRMFGFF